MQQFTFSFTVLLTFAISLIHAEQTPSAGACGPTSVANVPGCWGQPGCAYVIASDLGSGAACKFDYCNCGGTNVPLLPQTVSGSTTVGCLAYTTQPTANNCPTAATSITAQGSGRSTSSSQATSTSSTGNAGSGSSSQTTSSQKSASTGTGNASKTTSTGGSGSSVSSGSSSPKKSSDLTASGTAADSSNASKATSTGSSSGSESGTGSASQTISTGGQSPSTSTGGPSSKGTNTSGSSDSQSATGSHASSQASGTSGVGTGTKATSSQVPNTSTGPGPNASGHSSSSASLPPGATVVTATIGTAVFTQTFVPATASGYASLSSTITTSILNAQSSAIPIVIGPGGIEWTPINLPSGVPEVPPPSVLPSNSKAASITSATITSGGQSSGSGSNSKATTNPPTASPSGTASVSQASITDAFANSAQSETTLVVGGVTEHWSKSRFPELSTITAPTTVTTRVVQTNKDGTQFTLPAAIIIVGPGGFWWFGGNSGWGFAGFSCIWPFCPPGGGGDVGGVGSGSSPNDPNTPNSPEKPSDPDENNDNQSQSQSQKSDEHSSTITSKASSSAESSSATSSKTSSSSSASSCSASTIASDCSVFCSVASSATVQSCSTSCYSTVTGCSAKGTTAYSTATGGSCSKPTGWASVADGDDFDDYQPLGSAGIAAPGGVSGSGSTGGSTATSSGKSGTPGSSTATASSGKSGATDSTASLNSKATTGSVTKTTSGPGSASASITSASIPSCMADGAPWFSPTSWCDCGPSLTYPALPSKSGDTTANCDYTTIPSSTIKPVSTTSGPTNIPGENGVPGCAAVVSTIGTSAYCNCGGTPAPTLSPTSSGLMNCDYTIQPTSSYNPAIPPPSSASPPASSAPSVPWATGTCKVHVWEGLGVAYTDPQVVIDAIMTDAAGNQIGTGSSKLDWAQTLNVDSKLPYVLEITPQTGLKRRSTRTSLRKRVGAPPQNRPLFEKGPVDFAYGTQTWDTSSAQCTVGAFDNGNANDFFGSLIFGDNFIPNRQMDCTFDCPAPSSKKRDIAIEDSTQARPNNLNHRTPSATTNNPPTKVEDQLFDIRALYPRIPHGAAWTKYAPSGVRYYQAWKDKTGPDAVYQCNFEDDFEITLPVKLALPARGIRDTLQAEGYGIDREYYAITAIGPKNAADGPYADFQNTISSSQGVFLANANNRGALPSDPADPMYTDTHPNGRDPVPWQFSSVAWWMWTKTVLSQNPQWEANPANADYSGIKSFWRREIDNPDTKSILDDCFAGKDIHSVQKWTPEDTDIDNNPFWALLGSPNGNGIQYFLTDNKVAVHGKGIVSISATTVVSSDANYYTMWATFG